MVGTPLQRHGLDALSFYRRTYTPGTRFLSHDIALVLEPFSGLIALCAGDARSEPFTAVGGAVLVGGHVVFVIRLIQTNHVLCNLRTSKLCQIAWN